MDNPPEAADWRAALQRLEGAYAPSTLGKARIIFGVFEAWCRAEGRQALPASPETVAAYVTAVFERMRASSIRNVIVQIRRVHAALDLPDPTGARAVRLAYRRGARRHGTAIRQMTGLNAPLRDRMIAACGEDPVGRRDAAMIAVGYDLLARTCELVLLRIEELHPQPDGTAYVLMRQPKTAPGSPPRPAYMSARAWALVRRWLALADRRQGPLFRAVRRGRILDISMGQPCVRARIRARAREAGFAPEFVRRVSGHSLRVGAAQDLASSGRTLLEIMLAGRWGSLASVAGYTRQAQVNVWAPGDGDVFAHLRAVETRARARRRRGTWTEAPDLAEEA